MCDMNFTFDEHKTQGPTKATHEANFRGQLEIVSQQPANSPPLGEPEGRVVETFGSLLCEFCETEFSNEF